MSNEQSRVTVRNFMVPPGERTRQVKESAVLSKRHATRRAIVSLKGSDITQKLKALRTARFRNQTNASSDQEIQTST
jgi:hypothetical protein